MKKIIIFTLILYSIAIFSQTEFEKIYNGNIDFKVFATEAHDDGYIIGLSEKNSVYLTYDIKVIKTNSIGDTVWTRKYGADNSNEKGLKLIKTQDDGYIICGTNIIKIDLMGNLLWEKNYAFITAYIDNIVETNDSGFIFISRINESSYVAKIDSNGELIWSKSVSSNVYDIQMLANGNYILAGSKNVSSIEENAFILFIDDDGNELLSKEYNIDFTERIHSVKEMSNNNIILCGMTNFEDTAPLDIFIMQIDNTGDTIFTKRFGMPGYQNDERAFSICEGEDNNFFVTGSNDNGAFLLETDINGNEIFYYNIIGERGTYIFKTIYGEYIICGIYDSNNIFLKKESIVNDIEYYTEDEKLIVYPNPVLDKIYINCKINNTLELLDYTGKILISTKFNEIDMSNLENGVYFLKIKVDKTIFIKKIIKNN